jgi:hypothetical protein
MTRTVAGIFLLALACCPAGGQEADVFAAQPWKGTVSALVLTPDGARDAKSETGTGVARFVPAGKGRSRLEVRASIRRDNDSGFVIEGAKDAAGWSGSSPTLAITIDGDGRIHGGGTENQHRITFGGRASADRMDLRVETEKLAGTAGGTLPVGTRIVFDYRLEREASELADATAKTAPDAKGKKTCKRRVWKMRNVATPGGGMTMTQVPHCLD